MQQPPCVQSDEETKDDTCCVVNLKQGAVQMSRLKEHEMVLDQKTFLLLLLLHLTWLISDLLHVLPQTERESDQRGRMVHINQYDYYKKKEKCKVQWRAAANDSAVLSCCLNKDLHAGALNQLSHLKLLCKGGRGLASGSCSGHEN